MKDQQPIIEVVRVLFHLNGYTKVTVESTEGVGLADGGIVWELTTERIPLHLRKIGSRFVVKVPFATASELETEIEEIGSQTELEEFR